MSELIVFCFPYQGTGGVSLLFLKLAEMLAARGIDVAIVDYADGFMAKHRTESRLRLIVYDDAAEVPVPEDAIIVFQSITPWSIYPSLRISPSSRILFWNLHPFNLIPTMPGFRRIMQANRALGVLALSTLLRGYRQRIRRLISLLQSRGSLVFMDRANLEATERYLKIRIEKPQMLAVGMASASPEVAAKGQAKVGVSLRVAWIGRIVDFKFFILTHALRELNRLQPELGIPVQVIIMGAGDYQARLQRATQELQHLQVRFVDHLPPASLEDFITEQVDVLFAMGTSALEGVRVGVPTVLLDMSYRKVSCAYEFRWVHEGDGFTTGDLIDEQPMGPHNDSLKVRLMEALRDPEGVSARARAYFERHHSLDQVAANFLRVVAGAQCTFGQLQQQGLLDRGMVYSSFVAIRKLAHGKV